MLNETVLLRIVSDAAMQHGMQVGVITALFGKPQQGY
jgi:hypothetical protein